MTTETAELWLAEPNRYPTEAAEQIARRLQEAAQRVRRLGSQAASARRDAELWTFRRDALAEALVLILGESWSDNPVGPVYPTAQELIDVAAAGRLVAEPGPIVDEAGPVADVLNLRAHLAAHPCYEARR